MYGLDPGGLPADHFLASHHKNIHLSAMFTCICTAYIHMRDIRAGATGCPTFWPIIGRKKKIVRLASSFTHT